MNNKLVFAKRIKIPEWELDFRADRASGPGGQNVNKTATKVTLKVEIKGSKTLNDEQKTIIKKKLHNMMNSDGEIVIAEQSSRSQLTNRKNAMKKLNDHLSEALTPEKKRKATVVSEGSKERRLEDKKAHSFKKQSRAKIDFE